MIQRLSLDLGRALLAVLLAAALWMAIQTDENPDRTSVTEFGVPLEVVNAPPNLVTVGDPSPIQLRVRVPIDVWPRLRPSMFRASVDAATATAGTNELPITVERLDSAIRSAEAASPRASIVFEEIREVNVPIRVNLLGSVPFGYTSQQPKTQPDRLTVIGPTSRVQRVDAAVVDVRLDAVTVSVDASFTPRLFDARGSEIMGLRISPSTVGVTVEVAQQVTYKEVGIRPRITGKVASGYFVDGLDVEPSAATAIGDPRALADVNYIETQAIDVSNACSTQVRRIQLAPPRGIGLVQVQPVTVTVRLSAIDTTQVIRIQPTIQGLTPGYVLLGDVPPLDLTIRGPAPTLRALTNRDFSATLNVSGLEPGPHSLTPNVSVPSGIRLESTEPSSITVNLSAVNAADNAGTSFPVNEAWAVRSTSD
ncbi:MAG TPA: CdaR family protein [Chloroflexota bacterium]|nr:CdaR family protein [Chloroflexota bacterium]